MTTSSYASSLGVCTGEMAAEYQSMLSKIVPMKIPNQVDNLINYFKYYHQLTGFQRFMAVSPDYYFDSAAIFGVY